MWLSPRKSLSQERNHAWMTFGLGFLASQSKALLNQQLHYWSIRCIDTKPRRLSISLRRSASVGIMRSSLRSLPDHYKLKVEPLLWKMEQQYQVKQCLLLCSFSKLWQGEPSIAYEFAQLMSFDVSRKYRDMLIKHLSRGPPPGYSATTLAQLIKADQQVWAKLSEAGSDIRRNAAGEYPLDKLIISSLESYEISFYLLPMVSSTYGDSWASSSRPSPYDENPKGKGKSKGKGKRKTKGEHVQTWVPPKLRGGRPTNPAGSPSCFNYNLEGCDGAQPGSACPRGLHICCKCFKAHPFTGNHDPESKPRKPWLSRLCALEHKSLHEAFVIEIFAGTGGITAWLRKVTMTSSFGIDCVKFKHTKSPIVVLDLLTAEGERLLWDYLKNCREIGIWHMACTTVRNMFTSKGYRKWRTSATQVRFRTWRSLWLKLWTSTESQHCKCAIHADYKDHKFLLRWGTLLCGEPVFEHLLEDYRTQSHRTVWQFVRSVSRCMCVWI